MVWLQLFMFHNQSHAEWKIKRLWTIMAIRLGTIMIANDGWQMFTKKHIATKYEYHILWETASRDIWALLSMRRSRTSWPYSLWLVWRHEDIETLLLVYCAVEVQGDIIQDTSSILNMLWKRSVMWQWHCAISLSSGK